MSAALDIARDPFGERSGRRLRWRARVLGAAFEFSSNSRELLLIAQEAFGGMPRQRLAGAAHRTLRVTLEQVRDVTSARQALPPKPALSSGAGLLCAHVDSNNFVIVDPGAARALIQVGDSMLRHSRLVRYELIEFAAIMLATRTQGLVPLHAGCVGTRSRGVLLLGASGSGKSTITLHAALGGLDFLAEDSVFVQPATLRATGLSAYVHAREDALGLIEDDRMRRAASAAPCIQRRSGVRKREIDLRLSPVCLAPKPLRIVATVVLTARSARGAEPLVPLSATQLRRVLRREQAYAVTQPGWREFERRALRAGGFQLNRMPPAEGVSALRELLRVAR